MKVLISTDIEGVAGVFHHEQVRAGNPEYERARLLMTHEANAAIAGAFDGGATEVLVNDSHGSFRNMPPELLDARAQAVMRYLSSKGVLPTRMRASAAGTVKAPHERNRGIEFLIVRRAG